MINLEEAMDICRKASPNDDITEKYMYDGVYYFMLRPKSLAIGEPCDSAMNSVDAQTGELTYMNYVDLIYNGIADKLQEL